MLRFIRFIKGYKRNRHQRIVQFSIFFFLWAIAFAMFEYFAPLYLDSLGLNFLTIGIILSGSSFISFFIDPILGNIQRRFSSKTLLLTSIILFFINIFLFIYSQHIIFLLFLATNIYGVAFDLVSITCYKNVFDNSIEQDRSTNISFLESLYSLGLLIGSLIAGFVVSANLKNSPYLSLCILFVLLIIILLNKEQKKTIKITEQISIIKSYKDIFYELKHIGREGIFLISLLIFIHLFDGFFFVFEPIFAQKFDGYFFNELIIGGILLAIYSSPMIFFEPFFGKLEDRFGRKKFICIGLGISAISIYLLQTFEHVISSGIAIFFVSLGLYAITLPAVEGIYESLTEKKFGKSCTGYSASIMEITLSIGFLLGPLLGGILLGMKDGFNFAFRIFSGLALIILISSFVFLRKQKITVIPKSKIRY